MTTKVELQAELAEIERRTAGLMDDAGERSRRNALDRRLNEPDQPKPAPMSAAEISALARVIAAQVADGKARKLVDAIGAIVAQERRRHAEEIAGLRQEVAELRRQIEALTERAPLRKVA